MPNTREKLIKSLKLSPACICDLCGEEGALDRVAGVIAENLINDGAIIPVRCGECKGWCTEEIAKQYGVDRYCTMTMMPTDADDFCSYGERRADEGRNSSVQPML